jgi:hypothetical protein
MRTKHLLVAVFTASALLSWQVQAEEAKNPVPPVQVDKQAASELKKLPPKERISRRKEWRQKWSKMTPEEKQALQAQRRSGMTEQRMKALENYRRNTTPEQKAYMKQSLESRNGSRKEVLDRLKAAKAAEAEKTAPATPPAKAVEPVKP